jgi:hypothetical protein
MRAAAPMKDPADARARGHHRAVGLNAVKQRVLELPAASGANVLKNSLVGFRIAADYRGGFFDPFNKFHAETCGLHLEILEGLLNVALRGPAD